MVEIKLEHSTEMKNYFNTHLSKIQNITKDKYILTNPRINDISQRLFLDVDEVYHVTKKKWFSKKTHSVEKSKRICWLCYQDNYGIYLYSYMFDESRELADLLERNGYTVTIIVEDEKYLKD
jgi:energy-converting hydrogenase A subunit M